MKLTLIALERFRSRRGLFSFKANARGKPFGEGRGIPISDVRRQYDQPILGGVDEIDFQKLASEQMRQQWTEAREQAGSKYIAAPGCSVPDASTPDELARVPRSLGVQL